MRIHRLLGALLTIALLLCSAPMSVFAEPVSAALNGINKSRDTGELVVFTDAYGDTTGTNWWGAEVTVGPDNRVTALGSGNSDIPQGGFVLSGHDDETEGGSMMKTWVRDHVQVGDYVYFDRRTMTVTVSNTPLAMETSPFYEVSETVDAVNATRNEDMLIVYDTFIGTSTGTNAYGYEIAVDKDGLIISRGGNNTAIPAGGFVVSGHSARADWLRTCVIEGMRVTFDKDTKTVTFIYDEQSLRATVTRALEETETAISDAKAAFVYVDYATVEQSVGEIRAAFEAGATNDTAFADLCDTTLEALRAVQSALCDSYPVQYRGVWVRPSQSSAAEVERYVEELHNAGINAVSVEGFFENGYIFKLPEDSTLGRHPKFKYDVLQAYIDACHKFGMECHLWMPIMNVGYKNEGGIERTLYADHPEWFSLSQHGTVENPNGFCMIDPANEDARAYLIDFYKYLVTTYEIDGFELDYIRYYDRDELDFGYTEAAFAGFEEAYGHGVTPTYDTGASYWKDWEQYRRDCVTQMVREVGEMIRREAPDVIISADTAPTEDNDLYQDYLLWVKEGYIDVLHQMAYGDGFGPEITKAVRSAGNNALIVPALSTTDAVMMERQAREDLGFGTYGECFFEAKGFMNNKAGDLLKTTVYRQDALPPFLDPSASASALLTYMQERIDNVILPLEGLTEAEATAVKEAITAATASPDLSALEAVKDAAKAVENKTASKVMLADLYRTEQILLIGQKTASDNISVPAATDEAADMTLWIVLAVAAVLIIGLVVFALVYKPRKKTSV
ncbi:MAG: family 10 glycosylhydrolase [Clostridia bacterium]|nr:family 10 glycosylhydrolase [Clostridia bacterium]